MGIVREGREWRGKAWEGNEREGSRQLKGVVGKGNGREWRGQGSGRCWSNLLVCNRRSRTCNSTSR